MVSSARRFLLVGFLTLIAVTGVGGAVASHGPEDETTDASNDLVFSQNKQNEPEIAINMFDPRILAAGANDNIDLEGCNVAADNTCPFTPGVGVSGISFSTNGGASFAQPQYTGFSSRGCLGVPVTTADICSPSPSGPIGTLPWYFENGLVSFGDPVLAFGPKPGPTGFAWRNGQRLYYANLTQNHPAAVDETERSDLVIGLSRTDDAAKAATGGETGKNAWMPPVIVSQRQSQTTFDDKVELWVDNAASSPQFGNVYVCFVRFRSFGLGGAPEPVTVARSTDGGDTWLQRQISESANTISPRVAGRQGCNVRTNSEGVVFVFWFGSDPSTGNLVQLMARSFDGGQQYERPRPVVSVEECGRFDIAQSRLTFDGVAGARTNSFPSVDIANGAPYGTANGKPKGPPAPDTIVLAWCDGPTPRDTAAGPNEQALVAVSFDDGVTWSVAGNAAAPGDRPDFPAVAIAPDGTDVYLVYDGFTEPWQSATADPRPFRGVVRHASLSGTSVGAFTTVHEGAVGDARASSANALSSEFLGDYNAISATNAFAAAVWNDARNALACPAIDTWRQNRVNFLLGTGPDPGPPPAPQIDCPPADPNQTLFGNTDIFATVVADPS